MTTTANTRHARSRRMARAATVVVLVVAGLLGNPGPVDAQAAPGVAIDPTSNDFSLAPGATLAETITVSLDPGLAIGAVDVYLLADTTGSMSGPLTAVQSESTELIAGLRDALPDVDLRFGVGDYKDFPGGPYAFQHSQSITADDAAVQAAIATWSAGGGGDGPEGQFYAFDQLAENRAPSFDGSPAGTIGWRAGARRILVTFGDIPGHDPVCSEVTQTISGQGIDYDITEASVTTKFDETGTVYLGLSVVTGASGLDADPGPAGDYTTACGATTTGTAGQATRLAEATGGAHLEGVDSDQLVTEISGLVTDFAQSIDSLTLAGAGGTADFVAGVTPTGGFGPLDTTEGHTLAFEVAWTGAVAATAADQVFTGTLDVVADGVVVAQKPVRITVPGTGTTAPPAEPIDTEADFTG